jgi:hypothetical protein
LCQLSTKLSKFMLHAQLLVDFYRKFHRTCECQSIGTMVSEGSAIDGIFSGDLVASAFAWCGALKWHGRVISSEYYLLLRIGDHFLMPFHKYAPKAKLKHTLYSDPQSTMQFTAFLSAEDLSSILPVAGRMSDRLSCSAPRSRTVPSPSM